eukprot:CAMPEP_0175069152 /NCGR_PEP_ID=MMETSP0052_2-20121109/18046_1 /TAXON_ID=51329 ORGANISM="Polytomella parva, Strain SAG 63-3" /NCGR_SAMPLE_ID=MMETSP0052_2 /ASSEMBLY_ACC=CAM_ASM_000194 /LENGTH=67 /DNA_ID=CAMNT_0016336215 /DNA_START=368 /DNA_END=571 /DNA_ORIENTATION=+
MIEIWGMEPEVKLPPPPPPSPPQPSIGVGEAVAAVVVPETKLFGDDVDEKIGCEGRNPTPVVLLRTR